MAALLAVYFAAVMNMPFWRYVCQRLEVDGVQSAVFMASMPIVLTVVFYAAFTVLFWPYVGKAIIVATLIASSAATYFMYCLNVIIDSEMIRNVFEANRHEVKDMVTLGGIGWVLGFGMLPAALLIVTKIRYSPWPQEFSRRGVHLLASIMFLVLLGAFLYKDYAIAGRNNKMAQRLLVPFSYIGSTGNYIRKALRGNQPFIVIDDDPKHVPYDDDHYTVLVIMVGEAARAMNFSLNGYERETNPKLSRQNIVNFPNVVASGTATAFSVPCMFSHLPREKFNVDASYHSENLLDVMQKAGYDILWLDNDGGSKGVSNRVPTIDLMRDGNPKYRNGDTFFDEVLLDDLEERLSDIKRDTVIVLHMMGSHGPSYYRRYPEAFRKFTPTCDTVEIQSRPRSEIINTYDNTILYTDHVVSEAIDILKKFPNYEAGLLYVSDHGQSLGENGLYLHSFPYAFAPEEQLRVPMVLWMSETMQREDFIDYERLQSGAAALKLSHDHLFHSILGLVEIDTELYDPAFDFFRPYRTKPLPRAF